MPVRLLGFIKRLPTISFEEFDQHWTNHGALVQEHLTVVKNGTVKYRQFHKDPKLEAQLIAAGLPVLEFDGVAEWEAETLDEIIVTRTSEYATYLAPDEKKFLWREETKVMVGREQTEFTSGYTG